MNQALALVAAVIVVVVAALVAGLVTQSLGFAVASGAVFATLAAVAVLSLRLR